MPSSVPTYPRQCCKHQRRQRRAARWRGHREEQRRHRHTENSENQATRPHTQAGNIRPPREMPSPVEWLPAAIIKKASTEKARAWLHRTAGEISRESRTRLLDLERRRIRYKSSRKDQPMTREIRSRRSEDSAKPVTLRHRAEPMNPACSATSAHQGKQ